ncbi:hypothetical protein ZWY2020_051668 [Hordeum vulgare]|nr:hypothetical protein ZWY2020_051668 [Hordeum vulgare]
MLKDNQVRYAERMKAVGNDVELVVFDGKEHGFFSRDPWSETGGEVVRVVRRFMDRDAADLVQPADGSRAIDQVTRASASSLVESEAAAIDSGTKTRPTTAGPIAATESVVNQPVGFRPRPNSRFLLQVCTEIQTNSPGLRTPLIR